MQTPLYFVGIDIGSTASKVVILENDHFKDAFVLPTGWNGKQAALDIYQKLVQMGVAQNMRCVATGYGRVCVEYADKVVTEITCHGKGAWALFEQNGTVIDVGGQDTKIISISDGFVTDFLMNDKCAAGTGKFIEVMATRLGTTLDELYDLAKNGESLAISAMCTVFAESEVISHIGTGKKREDIAAGIIDSVASRVSNLYLQHGHGEKLFLTGGLGASEYFVQVLSNKIGQPVITHPLSRYAGALGAALAAGKLSKVILDSQELHAQTKEKEDSFEGESIVFSFSNTTQAMVFDASCETHHLPGKLIPLPSSVKAGCGFAWKMEPKEYASCKDQLDRLGLQYEKMHTLPLNECLI
jgi:predicted CoA-substrate-specific enzyme activase